MSDGLRKLARSVRANILVGLFLTVPVVVTVLIVNFLFTAATSWLLPDEFKTGVRSYPYRVIIILGLILLFYLIGLLVRNFFGRRLYRLGDGILTRIPLVRKIYVSVRQISESLFTQRKTLFKEVVLVEYPRRGLYSMAFATADVPPNIAASIDCGDGDEPCISLFIPTTPNPTSGILILVPRSHVVQLKLPVAEALTFIMSAGAVTPDADRGTPAPTLLDRLEAWLKHSDGEDTVKRDATGT